MTRAQKLLLVIGVAGTGIALAMPAGARGFHGRPSYGPHGHRGGILGYHPAGANKDNACRRMCRQSIRTCHAAARTDARLCSTATCSDQFQAVREACGADRGSDACHSARAALHQCLQPCAEDLRSALGMCRSDGKDCVASCPDRVPPRPGQKDPGCVAACRETLQDCQMPPRDGARTCRDGCTGLVDDARQACSEDRASGACQDARQAAYDCLQPCTQTLREAVEACLRDARSCVGNCPDRDAP